MQRWVAISVVGLCGLGLVACESSADATEEAARWQGEEPHFTARGLLNGEEIDIRIEGADAEDGSSVWCEREYEVPLVDGEPDVSMARHIETVVTGFATIGGEDRIFQFELKQHALQDDSAGDHIAIVPRVDEVPPDEDQAWFDWEWQTADEEDLFEASAQEGEVIVGTFSGEPGEGGVIIPEGEGFFGASADVRWSVDERLSISFTVLCTANDIEEL